MLDLLHQKAYEESKKRNPDSDDAALHDTAERLAISSLRFFLTKTDLTKDITFDLDEVLDMEGETGAYVLYSYARLHNVITQNSTLNTQNSIDYSLLVDEVEWEMVKEMDKFESVVTATREGLAPHLLCRYVLQMCTLLNRYYAKVNIKFSEEEIKKARIALLQQFQKTLREAMHLAGLQEVERM